MLILLKRIVKISGKKNICEVWPNLELYMHGGVNFYPYRSQFDALIPNNKMNYLEGYNASEGFFGIQDLKHSKGLLLLLNNGIFYEFIEISDYNKGIRETIGLDHLMLMQQYTGVPYEKILASWNRLFEKVVPRFGTQSLAQKREAINA